MKDVKVTFEFRRAIWNIIVIGVVLFIAWRLFPDVIRIDGFGYVMEAAIIYWMLGVTMAFLIAVIMIPLILELDSVEIVAMIVIRLITLAEVCVANFAIVYIVDKILPHFEIVGFWPKVALAICFSIFTPKARKFNN